MATDPDASPFNPLPPVVVALAVVIGGLELLFSLGARGILGGAEGVGWRVAAIQDFGFIDQVFDWMLANRTFPPEHMIRFLTYPLIHYSFTHALFVIVFILAIGNMVAGVFRPLSVLVLFFGSSIFGALVFALLLDSRLHRYP